MADTSEIIYSIVIFFIAVILGLTIRFICEYMIKRRSQGFQVPKVNTAVLGKITDEHLIDNLFKLAD